MTTEEIVEQWFTNGDLQTELAPMQTVLERRQFAAQDIRNFFGIMVRGLALFSRSLHGAPDLPDVKAHLRIGLQETELIERCSRFIDNQQRSTVERLESAVRRIRNHRWQQQGDHPPTGDQ